MLPGPFFTLLAIFAFLSGCAAVAPPPASLPGPPLSPVQLQPQTLPVSALWYVGHFTASYADARSTSNFSIVCSAAPDCETTIEELTPRRTSPQRILTKSAPRVSADILNNNLQAVRTAVAANPKLYDDANDGPLARRLRPVIESGGKFTECLGIAPDRGDSIALCTHAHGKEQVVVLLFSTMKGACADSAFCAYYLMPLARQK